MLFTEALKQKLLQPISEEQFCGGYLKSERAAFRPLRNAFNLSQTSLRKLSQNPDGNELELLQEENHNNWAGLSSSLIDVFSNSSRDIELIGWFISAQLIEDKSAQALAMTFEWLSELVENHWESLQPILPDSKLSTTTETEQLTEICQFKAKAFFQLLGDSEESSLLYGPFLMFPLVGSITFYQYQSAERKGKLQALKTIANSLSEERAIIQQKLDGLNRAVTAIEALSHHVQQRTQAVQVMAPNFNFISSLILKVEKAIEFLTGIKAVTSATATDVPQIENAVVENSKQPEMSVTGASQPVMNSATLVNVAQDLSQTAATNSMNRNIAFHQLREISNYFRESEPHSPVSFLLEKAIRWGGMSLPELLTEMVTEPDGDLLNRIFNTAGLDQSEQVMLPDVTRASVSVKDVSSASLAQDSQTTVVESRVEDIASETQQNQKSIKENSDAPTALRW